MTGVAGRRVRGPLTSEVTGAVLGLTGGIVIAEVPKAVLGVGRSVRRPVDPGRFVFVLFDQVKYRLVFSNETSP